MEELGGLHGGIRMGCPAVSFLNKNQFDKASSKSYYLLNRKLDKHRRKTTFLRLERKFYDEFSNFIRVDIYPRCDN